MKRDLQNLADQTFDLLVIGGGITGAGIARDAALRGLRVALVDQADFASGTSSRSSKLIHGGFRYLAQAAFGLVAEACRERRLLLDLAPHLVKPLPLLLLARRGDPYPLWQVRLGMTLYDLLARYQNVARHRTLSASATCQREPAVHAAGLVGAVRFFDAQEDDARFCIENILDAAAHGAVCANYCAVTGFEQQADRIIAAQVTDRHGGAGTFAVRAHVFINATGPWVPTLAPEVELSPTKGVHLFLPRLTVEYGVFWTARRDGRLVFVLPWQDGSLLGSTDTDYVGDPAEARTEPADVEYLLTALREIMPDAPTTIITTFAGIRPLLRAPGAPSARSREHRIVQRGANLLSVAGGKYTTYRAMAAQAVDEAYRLLGRRPAPCRTAVTPFPLRRATPAGELVADCPAVYASDIRQACLEEMALTVSDVMYRRTGLAISRHGEPAVAARVATMMAAALGWSDEQREHSLQEYVAEWNRNAVP